MSAARDREHDKWIPWYVDDTPGWLELSLAARGAMEGIARKLNDKTGTIVLRKGLPSLALLLHVSWSELEPAIAQLLATGKLTWDGSNFQLSDPDYLERRRRSGAERTADWRARKKADVTPVTSPLSPTSQASPVTGVTPVLVLSDLISSGSDLGSDARPPADGSPPAWWDGACDATIMAIGGEVLERRALWVQYLASRKRKVWSMDHTDAVGWLTAVLRSERRETSERTKVAGERTAAIVRERHGPEVKALPSVAPLVNERKRWEAEAATPADSAAAAANLRKLLGGVGR